MNKAMKIPESFELIGKTYKVMMVDDLTYSSGDRMVGQIQYDPATIRIQTNNSALARSEDSVLITYWHEVVHAVLSDMGEEKLSKDEKFVDLFASMLHQINKTSKFKEEKK